MSDVISTTAAELAEIVDAAALRIDDGGLALSELPQPDLIAAVNFRASLDARAAHYADLVAAAGLPRPDILNLVSTPEVMLLEEAVYLETLITARINEAYRGGLLYFAAGADLDHVAELSGVARLDGEPDEDLRRRVRIRNRGQSAAGPVDWWRTHALAADEGIEDVAVTRATFPVPGANEARGAITVWILADSLDGEPTDAQVAAVRAALTSPSVRGATTAVTVQPATRREVSIAADVWMTTDAPVGAFEALPTRLAERWATTRRLGWSVYASWVHAALMAPSVARVTLTGWTDVVVAPHEAPKLGAVTLTRRA